MRVIRKKFYNKLENYPNQQQIGSEKIRIASKSKAYKQHEPWYYWELCVKAPPEVMVYNNSRICIGSNV
jgi:hypothetical protein